MTETTRNSADFLRRSERGSRYLKPMTTEQVEKVCGGLADWAAKAHPEWFEDGFEADSLNHLTEGTSR